MLPLPLGEKSVFTWQIQNGDETAGIGVFHSKNLSNGQDKPSTSTSGENTDACSRRSQRSWAPKNTVMFHLNET